MPTATTTASTNPSSAPIETNAPGDIPDNQAYVPFTGRAATGASFTIKIPEGWARTASGSTTTFTDKYASIAVDASPASAAPTTASAQSTEIPQLQASVPGYVAGKVSTVQRSAGSAVLITYQGLSAVNPVTGKVAKEDVERYEFWRSGVEVVVTLAAPVGSDNVDPWRTVTDSFAWAG